MSDERTRQKYFQALAFAVCALPYAAGWPRSWLAALAVTAVFYPAMLWVMRRMPLKRADVGSSTQWLVLAFAVLMISHAVIIRALIGLPILAR